MVYLIERTEVGSQSPRRRADPVSHGLADSDPVSHGLAETLPTYAGKIVRNKSAHGTNACETWTRMHDLPMNRFTLMFAHPDVCKTCPSNRVTVSTNRLSTRSALAPLPLACGSAIADCKWQHTSML
jgi:hypothetical protein